MNYAIAIICLLWCFVTKGAVYNWTNDAQWGNNSPSVGDTVNLLGTFNTNHTIAWSGVTFYFEPNTQFSNQTIPANSAFLTVSGQSNVIIDGGVNGLMQLTDNCSTGYTNINVSGVLASGCLNLTVRNLTISNMYNRQTNTEPTLGAFPDAYGIHGSGSGLLVSNCTLTGADTPIAWTFDGVQSNMTVMNCVISNFNHGIALASSLADNSLFNNVTITHNTINTGDMYETADPTGSNFHRDPIFIFGQGGASAGWVTNITIAYNYIQAGFKPQVTVAGTSAIFVGDEINLVYNRIYNNIVTNVPPLNWSPGQGFIESGGSNVICVNNTLLSSGGINGYSLGGTNIYNYNNLEIDGDGVFINNNVTTTNVNTQSYADALFMSNMLSGIWSDYNIFSGSGNNQGFTHQVNSGYSSGGWGLLEYWNQFTNAPYYYTNGSNVWLGFLSAHADPHSTTNTVIVNAQFTPVSPPISGTNLTLLLSSFGVLNPVDFNGNPYPAAGLWIIGAIQIVSATGNIFNIVPAGNNPSGNTIHITQ